MKKSILCLLLLAPTMLVLGTVSHAQDKALKKIRWGVTSLSASQWIPWIAKEAKIYDKHGLDVQLVLLRGSGQTSAALLGGSIFAAPVVLPTLMLADLSGATVARRCRRSSRCVASLEALPALTV
jgi:ABC-type nitrate/sulfonate/bicarbonate transport system substrate-binding protein